MNGFLVIFLLKTLVAEVFIISARLFVSLVFIRLSVHLIVLIKK